MAPLVLLVALFAMAPSDAQTIYKCLVDGRIQYRDTPCFTGPELKRMAPDGGPTAEDRARAQMRLREAMARQRAEDAAATRAREEAAIAQRWAYEREARDRAAKAADAYENEKVLTHDISGWDRKPRGQIAQEQAARDAARAQARAGGAFDPATAVPQRARPAAWEAETTMTHSISGWSRKSRSQQVKEAANRAYQNEKDDMEAERLAATRAAEQARRTLDEKRSGFVMDDKGQSWWIHGSNATNDRGKTCSYNSSNDAVSCP